MPSLGFMVNLWVIIISKSNKKQLENEKDIPVEAWAPVRHGDMTLVKGISRPKRRFIPLFGLFFCCGAAVLLRWCGWHVEVVVVLVLLVGIGSSSLFNKNFMLVLKQRKKRYKKTYLGARLFGVFLGWWWPFHSLLAYNEVDLVGVVCCSIPMSKNS